MDRIVITDLTHFKDDKVCMAGLTPEGQRCVRPLPYLTHTQYRDLGIKPGVTIAANSWGQQQVTLPHIEDYRYTEGTIHVVEDFNSHLLNSVLSASAVQALDGGFGATAEHKHIPLDPANVPERSIITLEVAPRHFALQFTYEKVKAEFTDQSGCRRSFIPVADIGINNYVHGAHDKQRAIININHHLQSQGSLFLRVGIGRAWLNERDGRNGYWFQVNAAYSFPYLHELINEY
jgi:hypothetical protein